MALNMHVTAQQYDQTLRDSVNAYYQHALNDPSMSREEAMRSTAQMAERAISASEDFHASMASQNANAQTSGISSETPGISGGETGGISGGETGGIDGGDSGGIDGGDGIE